MNSKTRRTDFILCFLFLLFLLIYILVCRSCFKSLPVDCPTCHIWVVLYFQCVPMFFLQLLLCRKTRIFFRVMIPIILAILVGLVFFYTIDWHAAGWPPESEDRDSRFHPAGFPPGSLSLVLAPYPQKLAVPVKWEGADR